jgi:CPA2 family monovalent cation:H+ antiporter-2
LTAGAKAVGKTLGALDLKAAGAEATAVRRGKVRLDITPDLVLEAADIVVLRGTTEGVARAETKLL